MALLELTEKTMKAKLIDSINQFLTVYNQIFVLSEDLMESMCYLAECSPFTL